MPATCFQAAYWISCAAVTKPRMIELLHQREGPPASNGSTQQKLRKGKLHQGLVYVYVHAENRRWIVRLSCAKSTRETAATMAIPASVMYVMLSRVMTLCVAARPSRCPSLLWKNRSQASYGMDGEAARVVGLVSASAVPSYQFPCRHVRVHRVA